MVFNLLFYFRAVTLETLPGTGPAPSKQNSQRTELEVPNLRRTDPTLDSKGADPKGAPVLKHPLKRLTTNWPIGSVVRQCN